MTKFEDLTSKQKSNVLFGFPCVVVVLSAILYIIFPSYEPPIIEEPKPIPIQDRLPHNAILLKEMGNGYHEVAVMVGFEWSCFMFNERTDNLQLIHRGTCGDPEPKYKAEVKITSDDVLNAITGKKLIWLSKKDVKTNEDKQE